MARKKIHAEAHLKITVKKGKLAQTKTQSVILLICEDEKKLSGEAAAVDNKTGGLVKEMLKSTDALNQKYLDLWNEIMAEN